MKNNIPSHGPRPGDMTRADGVDFAEGLIKKSGGPDKCAVRFKFTCPWCGQLAAGLGKMNAVIVYRTKLVNGTQILKLIGRKEDVEIVRSLYIWLRSETMRLLKENVPPGVRGKIIRAYCLGVVETILKRLRCEQEKTFAAASTMAVMRVQNQLALVQKWTDEQKKLKKSGGRIGSQDAEGAFARVQGRIDGNKARLTPAKELGQ